MVIIKQTEANLHFDVQIEDENKNILFYLGKTKDNELLLWEDNDVDLEKIYEQIYTYEKLHSFVATLETYAKKVQATYIVISAEYDYFHATELGNWKKEGFQNLTGHPEHIYMKRVD